MQQLNTSLILDVIKREGPISRSQIAERTKLSNPAVSAIIASLLEEGLVDEVGVAASTGGRRARLLQFNPSAGFLIGIDVGGTKMYGGAVDLAGNIIARQSIFSKGGESTEDSIQRLMGLIYDLIEKVDLPVQSFKGIGLGIPGVTDSQGQRVRLAPGIGWENVDVGQVLTGEFGVPLFADNDANCFARGELWRGKLQGAQNAIAMTIGTGIGVGLVLNGHVYHGSHRASGEVGYWLLGSLGPIERRDTQFGPLESLASGTGIAAAARRDLEDPSIQTSLREAVGGDLSKITAVQVFQGAKEGDEYCQRLVEKTTTLLGILCANMASLLDVEKIVIGGGVSRVGQQILAPIQDIVGKLTPYPPEIFLSEQQEDAAILGAVAGVLDQRASMISFSQLP
ncbi:MAG TPA: ROK family transcriptional regulator [Limnochordia bacterium]|jgi:predicted NBD/HSP70 family sugar kinase|nr:ROK family transcriptional regulator [Limnochordia bacterium]